MRAQRMQPTLVVPVKLTNPDGLSGTSPVKNGACRIVQIGQLSLRNERSSEEAPNASISCNPERINIAVFRRFGSSTCTGRAAEPGKTRGIERRRPHERKPLFCYW